MSINRVDVRGSFIRTSDMNIKANEENRQLSSQSSIQTTVEKEVEMKMTRVMESSELDKGRQEKHDAKEKGKNTYFRNEKKRGGRGGDSSEDGEVIPLGTGAVRNRTKAIFNRNGEQVDSDLSSGFDFKV